MIASVRIAVSEFLRISAGPVAKLAVLALVLVPTVYGGLYLYANNDPYANLDKIPVALVVLDNGARLRDGSHINAGSQVAQDLVNSGSYSFNRVSPHTAREGIHSGVYDFALTIPSGFSHALASSTAFNPRTGKLVLTTNDANGYLGTMIADRLTETVRASLSKQVGRRAAEEFLLGFTQLRSGLSQATNAANKLVDDAAKADLKTTTLATDAKKLAATEDTLAPTSQRLLVGAGTVKTGAVQLATDASTLSSVLSSLTTNINGLPTQASQLAQSAQLVATGNGQLAGGATQLAQASIQAVQQLTPTRNSIQKQLRQDHLTDPQVAQVLALYDQLKAPVQAVNQQVQATKTQVDQLSGGATQVANGANQLAGSLSTMRQGLSTASTGAGQLDTGAQQVSAGAAGLARRATAVAQGQHTAQSEAHKLATATRQLSSGAGPLHTGTAKLAKALQAGLGHIPSLGGDTSKATASTIADTVLVDNVDQTKASSYSAGLAPLLMSLSAWIGGYVLLLLVRPLSRRAMAADQPPLRVALAGWYTPALLGLAQMVFLLAVVWFGLGIAPVHILGTAAFLLLISATFVAVVHTLSAWFGTVGQLVGLVLLMLQLVSSGGTFPWQTLPVPLQALHYALPMSYAVDGLRRLMDGGDLRMLGLDAGVLGLYLVAALWLSSVAAGRQRVWTSSRIRPKLIL